MAKVAQEMVEKAGVDVDRLVELLVKNAAAELTTFYYYTILQVNLMGLEGEGIKEIAKPPGLKIGTTCLSFSERDPPGTIFGVETLLRLCLNS